MKATPEQVKELLKWAVEKTGDRTFDEQNLNWLMNEFLKSKPNEWEIVSGDDARTEPALPIQSVSGWAYIRKHLKPILIGFATGITLMNLFSLIENIVLKLALIIHGG